MRQEGPVHEGRVLNAVRSAWGKGKSGSRIKEAFTNAVRDLCRSTMDRDRNGFLRVSNTAVTAVRVPGADDPRTEREVKHVPPEELKLAIRRIVVDAHTVTHDDLSQHVARLFGWRRRGTEIRATLDDATAELLRSGDLLEDNGTLTSSSDLDDIALPGPVRKPSPPVRGSSYPQLPLGSRPRRTRS